MHRVTKFCSVDPPCPYRCSASSGVSCNYGGNCQHQRPLDTTFVYCYDSKQFSEVPAQQSTNIDYTAVLEKELDALWDSGRVELIGTNAHEMAAHLNSVLQNCA